MDARTTSQQHPNRSAATSLKGTVSAHPYAAIAVAIAVIVALAAVIAWWLHARGFESTDDAFIDARVTQISSQVNGAIVEVPVTDNQNVEAGGALVKIDDRDYRASLEQAKAQIAQGIANVANLTAQLDAQQARIEEAKRQVDQNQGALAFALAENQRYQ